MWPGLSSALKPFKNHIISSRTWSYISYLFISNIVWCNSLWRFYLFQELDGLVVGRRSVEMEKETLMERLEASKRVIEAARRESHCLEKQVEELERKLQSSQGETQTAEEKLQMFLKKVAGLLQGKSENVILPTEKDVLHKVDNLCNKVRSQSRDFWHDFHYFQRAWRKEIVLKGQAIITSLY